MPPVPPSQTSRLRRLCSMPSAFRFVINASVRFRFGSGPDMNEAAKFREKAISVRIAATERLDALSKLSENKYTGSDNASVVSACSGPGSTRNNDVRLPKLVLPKFSGDILEFETF